LAKIYGRNMTGMDAEKIQEFRDLALKELKRAERYRNFLSLLVLNLSEFLATAGRRKIKSHEDSEQFLETALNHLKNNLRETDAISILDNARLAMLLPETDQYGASVAAGRFRELIAEFLAEFIEADFRFDVDMEIASFPSNAKGQSFKSRLGVLFTEN